LYQIIADHSGAPYEKVWDASDRDHWMIAEEAKEFGMIDEILRGNNPKK
jgi:ATP-dependent Clp protease protease subunit